MAAPMRKSKSLTKSKKRGNTRNKKHNFKPTDSVNEAADDSFRDSAIGIKVKGAWKSVDVNVNLFSPDELNEFDGVEELTDYELVQGQGFTAAEDETCTSAAIVSPDLNKKGQKRKHKDEAPSMPKKTKQNIGDDGDSEVTGVFTVPGEVVLGSRTVEDDSDNGEFDEEVEEDQVTRTSKSKRKEEKDKKSKLAKGKKVVGSDSVDDMGRDVKGTQKSKQRLSKQEMQQQRQLKQDQKNQKEGVGSYTKGVNVPQRKQALDMSAWEPLAVPKPVLQALQDMGFTKPSPIQSACIPAAIKQRKDIMGAAETGSGKTLAFGIPIIHHILRLKEQKQKQQDQETSDEEDDITKDDEDAEEPTEDAEDSDNLSNSSEEDGDDGESDGEEQEEEEDDDEENEEEEEMDGSEDDLEGEKYFEQKGSVQKSSGDLLALVMAPTRELAVQVKNHLVAAAKYTNIKIAVVVGGISAEKQQRLLKKKPEIVVGTPGRLWELFLEREPHLSNNLAHIRYLVIDEADRMVERGHYMELANIMDLLNGSHMQKKRQNFIFSATLTMVHIGPRTQKPTNKPKEKDKTKLDTVLAKVSVRQNAKVVDLTSKEGTVATLLEGKIVCNLSEKDIYLYYFLLQYPGRTLVFTNSIECIRRMMSILTLLQCNPLSLHSSMHQRQRLKNLDRFAANPMGLLVATDVAARGLDIPNVQNVIHYHVPKTSESYVHRSGRTARQAKEGLSIMLVSAQEVKSFRKVCKALNRDDLPNFPTELKFYEAVKERVDLARQVDKLELSMTKKKKQNQWYENAAKEMEVDLDDWIINDIGSDVEQKQHNNQVKHLRGELKSLLKKKIFPRWSSQLYPTLDGALVQPFVSSDSAAAMSSFKTKITKEKQEDDTRKEKKKRKFRKFKRNQKYKKQSTESSTA
ncbi:ATP-dependent RNA helicase DDX24-like [Amphiura filiformis]|uniref:ATP-dependent RNA helicase DDX24-like n=1 Tax=Amphiura filiformis TaxID=82378 RepID=UPI003B217B3B